MAIYDANTDGGGSYGDMASAETALPATPSEEDTITCAGSTVDTSNVVFSGYSRTASFPLNVVGDKEYTISAAVSVIQANSDYINFKDLNIVVDTAASYVVGLTLNNDDCVVDSCYLREENSGSNGRGIAVASGTSGNVVKNSIIEDVAGSESQGLRALGTCELYNNLIVNCTRGVIQTGNVTLSNNASLNNTDYDYGATSPAGGSNNASSDSSAPGSSPITSVPYSAATFVSVTGGSEDYHIADTDSDLYQAGVPVTGVDYDFDGEAWDSSTPSVGAYEFVSGGEPVEDDTSDIPVLDMELSFNVLTFSTTEDNFVSIPVLDLDMSFNSLPVSTTENNFSSVPLLSMEMSFNALPVSTTENNFSSIPLSSIEISFNSLPVSTTENNFFSVPVLDLEFTFNPLPISTTENNFSSIPAVTMEISFGSIIFNDGDDEPIEDDVSNIPVLGLEFSFNPLFISTEENNFVNLSTLSLELGFNTLLFLNTENNFVSIPALGMEMDLNGLTFNNGAEISYIGSMEISLNIPYEFTLSDPLPLYEFEITKGSNYFKEI